MLTLRGTIRKPARNRGKRKREEVLDEERCLCGFTTSIDAFEENKRPSFGSTGGRSATGGDHGATVSKNLNHEGVCLVGGRAIFLY